MSDCDRDGHMFGSGGHCHVCAVPAPPIPEFLRRQNADATVAQQRWFDTAQRLGQELVSAQAKLADCQAVIRSRGHDADCSVTQQCKACGMPKGWSPHLAVFDDYPAYHEFQPGPCSDACGYDRTTGEKE